MVHEPLPDGTWRLLLHAYVANLTWTARQVPWPSEKRARMSFSPYRWWQVAMSSVASIRAVQKWSGSWAIQGGEREEKMEPLLQVMCMKLAQNGCGHYCCWCSSWASEFGNIWPCSGYSSPSWGFEKHTESCYPMNSLQTKNDGDWSRGVCFTRMCPHPEGKWKTHAWKNTSWQL